MSPGAYSRTALASLRIHNYRLFASGQVVSLIGTWMARVAQDWLVLKLTGSGTALGIVTGLQFLPTLLFSLYGGLLADRLDKRRLLMATQCLMGLESVALGVLVVTGEVQTWQVFVLAAVLGTFSAVDTPTRQAFVTELVGPDNLANAVSLNSATFNVARIIGPAVAGLLIGLLGGGAAATGPVFLINTVSYAAVVFSLSRILPHELHQPRRTARAPGQLREGLAYVRGRRDVMLIIGLVFVVGTVGLNFQLTLALIAAKVYGRGAGSYGLLSTALAVGSLIGALASAGRARPRQRTLVGAAIVFGLLEAGLAFAPSYWVLAAMLVPTGLAVLTFTTTANSLTQLSVDAEYRGRVMALYVLVFIGGTPVGAPLIGWLSQNVGVQTSLATAGLIVATAGLVAGVCILRWGSLRVDLHLDDRKFPRLQLRYPEPIEPILADQAVR